MLKNDKQVGQDLSIEDLNIGDLVEAYFKYFVYANGSSTGGCDYRDRAHVIFFGTNSYCKEHNTYCFYMPSQKKVFWTHTACAQDLIRL